MCTFAVYEYLWVQGPVTSDILGELHGSSVLISF